MSKKSTTVFMCTDCGNEFVSWQGQCSYCGAWNTIKEQKLPPVASTGGRSSLNAGDFAKPIQLGRVGVTAHTRLDSGIGELNRVLGGGIVPGSLVLISGEPGIGKSTLLAQLANNIATSYGKTLYVTGEESDEQVKLRTDRVCCNNQELSERLYIYPETNIENILSSCEQMEPKFLILDSIQTMYSASIDNGAGSITQIRAVTNLIMKYAKSNGVPVFIVAHINKSGELAGPKTIEHMVDCVLSFAGERDRDLRILRSFKNRFGTTDEIGAWTMGPHGMIEVQDLSGSLLQDADSCEPGSIISATYEGSRPVFHEIQALVTSANVGFARRATIGIDSNRLNMILAVLERHAGIKLINYDVYVNVAGGLKTVSPATDLAVALAIVSSARKLISPRRIACIGEIGLTGRLRAVAGTDKIISEAARLGYEAIIIPTGKKVSEVPALSAEKTAPTIIRASYIADAIKQFANK